VCVKREREVERMKEAERMDVCVFECVYLCGIERESVCVCV